MNEKGFYRPNVGIMILNKAGEVWLGKRADGARFPYNKQMPQGGIDIGETPQEAVYRELWEETGLTKESVILIAESRKWYTYDFPHPKQYGSVCYIGQRQKWFLFLYDGDGQDFNFQVHPEEIEFESYGWYSLKEALSVVVPFKRSVYRAVFKEFQPKINALMQEFSEASVSDRLSESVSQRASENS